MKDYCYNCIFLPYVIQKIDDETGGWVVLNREYKFLGTTNWSVYENTPPNFRIATITDETKQRLNAGCYMTFDDKIYLFYDRTSPLTKNAFEENRQEYSRKIQILSQLKTFSGEKLIFSLLTAIERINSWDLPYKISEINNYCTVTD